MEPLSESTRTLSKPPCCRSSQPQPPPLPLPLPLPRFQIPANSNTSVEQNVVESTSTSKGKAVEIIKGDTLWGLSTKYGVSIQEIKEANGLTSDTIYYAGKKLIIPN